MGKGSGGHPPQKFIGDGIGAQIATMIYIPTAITMSSLSAGMDDGGSFQHQYFFTGFVLGIILLVQQISRWYVTRAVERKGLTRNNIVEVLTKTTIGSLVWPWSCRIGMMWCIPGTIMTGLGGVNCGIEKDPNGNRTAKNDCYYDIEGDHGSMYKGFAICLIVIHCFSFGHFLLSQCPVHVVLDQIKEDPKLPAPKKVAAKNTPKTTANNAPAKNQTSPSTSAASGGATSTAATKNAASGGAKNNAASGSAHVDIELTNMKKQLDERAKQIEKREKELAEKERKAAEADAVPPPPSYYDLVDTTNHI